MKTVAELRKWCKGAVEEFGDPSIPVGQIFVRFQQVGRTSKDLVAGFAGDELLLNLFGGAVPLCLDVNGPRLSDDLVDSSIEAFGVRQIEGGCWYLTPSLNIPGFLHVFVVVYGVPSPAPWERRIIL